MTEKQIYVKYFDSFFIRKLEKTKKALNRAFLEYLRKYYFSSFLVVFFTGVFFSSLISSFGVSFFIDTFSSTFSSLTSTTSSVVFRERPILFSLGSKVITFASTSSPTFTKSSTFFTISFDISDK